MGVCKPTVGELPAEEMSTALTFCIKRAQELVFAVEIYALKMNLELPLKSNLHTFRPFLYEIGQLSVERTRSTRDAADSMGAPHTESLH
ncbi:hypothetical protein OUZ56_033261 [Daphnia magna]|uniref:Uncharacterized protein n=1 Tax=Daphnia magna TaxID=35525 RepID=A0ABQ9ZXJ7_9CRUS|nr:hypothetical protein OUZ56_033261 [Daphnia magna]